jgi:hypothetical protein
LAAAFCSAGAFFSVAPSIQVVGFVHSGMAEQAARRPATAAAGKTRKTKRDID